MHSETPFWMLRRSSITLIQYLSVYIYSLIWNIWKSHIIISYRLSSTSLSNARNRYSIHTVKYVLNMSSSGTPASGCMELYRIIHFSQTNRWFYICLFRYHRNLKYNFMFVRPFVIYIFISSNHNLGIQWTESRRLGIVFQFNRKQTSHLDLMRVLKYHIYLHI